MATTRKRPAAPGDAEMAALAEAERLRIRRRRKLQSKLDLLLSRAGIGVYSMTLMVEDARAHGVVGVDVANSEVDTWPEPRPPGLHNYARSRAPNVCEVCGAAQEDECHDVKM